MTSPNLIVTIKRAAIACMAIALAITSSLLLMKQSPPQGEVAAKDGNIIRNSGKTAFSPDQSVTANDHLASVAVIILNSATELPLSMKVADTYIKIPGPSSWPSGGDNSATVSENGRFIAGIVDTADVLKANGFNPDDAFSFIVGDTTLNASNTFRVAGNHQASPERNNSDGYSEEFHTLPGEEGIWRSLKFKNIVLSYGQVPTLADFLVKPPILPAENSSAMAVDSPQPETDIQKYRDAMNDPDPAIRADGILNLMHHSDELNADKSHPGFVTYLGQALTDPDPAVREAALRSLDMWDGNIPMQTLSRIALSDQNPDLRLHALGLLVDRFDEKSVPTLQQASHDSDSRVAQKASQLLSTYSP